MTQVTGTIAGIRVGEPAQTEYGILNVYYLDIDTPNGRIEGGNLRAKTYEPKVGESITVDVRSGQHGPLLKRITEQGVQGGSSSGGGSAKGRTDATGRSIERQVALKCAAEFYAGKTETPVATVVATAEAFDEFLAASARSGGTSPPPASPAADSPGVAEGADTAAAQPQPVPVAAQATAGDDIPF